ncbi:hypothetical protein WJX72_001756 [[Myrmecia] bisecta]|uniref:Glycosyltransferase n=1 Tax=[Myrmecia] bisecta TaxID=41462 RepID=A0AAW1P904_9CHLO
MRYACLLLPLLIVLVLAFSLNRYVDLSYSAAQASGRSSEFAAAAQQSGSTLGEVRKTRVVIALVKGPTAQPSQEAEEACLTAVLTACTALGSSGCYSQQYSSQAACQGCFADAKGKYIKHKHNYILPLKRAIPVLQHLGWTHIQVVNVEEPASVPALQQAELIIAFARIVVGYDTDAANALLARYPAARFVAIDTIDWATLYDVMDSAVDNARILAVWKHSILNPIERNNGPLDTQSGAVHMAYIRGFPVRMRDPPLSPVVLQKMAAMTSHVFAFRYPLDYSGKVQYARFAGFFRRDPSLWNPKPLQERTFDVAFVGKMSYKYSPEIGQHRTLAALAVKRLKRKHPHLQVHLGSSFDLPDYLALLLDTKVFISPYGMGEWSYKDFEAIMCGCVLIKPLPKRITAYPNIYEEGCSVIGVNASFIDLEPAVLQALSDPVASAGIVTAGQEMLRTYSDVEHYAHDVDRALVQYLTAS